MAKEERPAEGKGQKSSGKLNIIMYLVTLIVLTGVAFAMVRFMMPQLNAGFQIPAAQQPQNSNTAQTQAQAQPQPQEPDYSDLIDKPAEPDPGSYNIQTGGELYELGEIITNPAETEGTRFLKVKVFLELRASEDKALIEKANPVIRHAVSEILGTKTVTELEDSQTRTQVRKELVKAINNMMGKVVVMRVFFPDFVIQ